MVLINTREIKLNFMVYYYFLENKQSKLDNIQTMAEAKHALKLALDQITDLVKQQLTVKTKLLDTQANFNEVSFFFFQII